MTEPTSTAELLERLCKAVGVSRKDVENAERGFNAVFVWNIAVDETDLDGWTLLSDQFVQLGDDHQLATGVWENDLDGTVVRTDVQAFRDQDDLIAAMVRKLAGSQTGSFHREDLQGRDGLRFVLVPAGSVICQTANLLIDLIPAEEGDANLITLSDLLIDSILPTSEGFEETVSEDLKQVSVEAMSSLSMAPTALRTVSNAKELDALLACPIGSAPERPGTREDRPERLVVRTSTGRIRWIDGRLVQIADEGGKAGVTISVKQRGSNKRALQKLEIETDERDWKERKE